MKHFRAPWGRPLLAISTAATALCLGITSFQWWSHSRLHHHLSFSWPSLVPLALILICALFVVRGYTLTPDTLLVHRLFWSTHISLTDFQSAEVRPRAMKGSLRTFGNGGFFSFTGRYWSRALGSYQAFVTDFNRTAILRFTNRTVVISPESPDEFVHSLSTRR